MYQFLLILKHFSQSYNKNLQGSGFFGNTVYIDLCLLFWMDFYIVILTYVLTYIYGFSDIDTSINDRFVGSIVSPLNFANCRVKFHNILFGKQFLIQFQ